jgi:hypothetical protein
MKMPILSNYTRAKEAKEAKEAKQAVADQRHLKRKVYIAGIATKMEMICRRVP